MPVFHISDNQTEFMQVSDPKQTKLKVTTSLESNQFIQKLKQNWNFF